jgi:hypothetical protein
MFDRAGVRQWLSIIHGDAPGLVHVCATGAWTGRVFRTDELDGAADYAAALDAQGREGVYARITTLRTAPAPQERGGVADTLALPALWADIDLRGPGHAEHNLPPDEDAAGSVVSSSGLPEPTLWVHSGGGLYPIWLLDEPYELNGDGADVAELSANWQKAIGAGAALHGWRYGTGVGDLARVLRIPGTVNRKAGLARPCRIVGGRGHRYELHDLYRAVADALTALIPDPPPAGVAAPSVDPDGYTSPGDDYANRNDWSSILEPFGWRLVFTRGDVRYWRRPGKAGGISATTNALGTDRLRVFTTATDFEARGYSKLAAYAVLHNYGNDLTAAATQLRREGFGDRPGPAQAQREAIADLIPHDRAATLWGLPVLESTAYPAGSTALAGSVAPTEPEDVAAVAAARREREIAAEMYRQGVLREARRRLDAETVAATWRTPPGQPSFADDLQLPDEAVEYRIAGLLPMGANAVLVAPFKAGKTTLCNNLIRALVDGEDFLGRFPIAAPNGRVAVWNYEVSEGQYRRWLRDIGLANPDRLTVLNLRGFRMPVVHAHVEDWIVDWLTAHKIGVWLVDPFARAFVGCGDENGNSDVGVFLDTLDVIKERAGVGELILPIHTGRAEHEAGQERARGASRLDDWADARWILTRDGEGRRFFAATGRDVDVEEELLTFDPDTRRLTFGGWDRRGMAGKDLIEEVAVYVAEHPGLGVNELVLGMGRSRNRVVAAVNTALATRRVVAVEVSRGKRLHYPPGYRPTTPEEAP